MNLPNMSGEFVIGYITGALYRRGATAEQIKAALCAEVDNIIASLSNPEMQKAMAATESAVRKQVGRPGQP